MKIKLLFLFIFLSVLNFAQNLKCTFNDQVFKYDYYVDDYGIIGEDDQYFYGMRDEAKDENKRIFAIYQFNKATAALQKKVVVSSAGLTKKNSIFHSLKNIGGQFYFFQLKEVENKCILVSQKLSSELVLNPEVSNLDTVNLTKEQAKLFYPAHTKINILLSPDKSKFAVMMGCVNENLKKEYSYKVFDKNQKLIYGKSFIVPQIANYYTEIQSFLDNAGDLYLLGKFTNYIHDAKNDVDIAKSTVELLCSKNSTKSLKEYPIVLTDKSIQSIGMKYDEKGNRFIFGGIYIDDNKNTDGSFISVLSKDVDKMSTLGFKEFTANYIERMHVFSTRRPAPVTYIIGDILVKDNGDITLIAQHTHHVDYENPNGRLASSANYFREIIIVNVKVNGDMWIAKIPKGSANFRYNLITKNNNLHIVFDDIVKNSNRVDGFTVDNSDLSSDKTIVVVVTVDSNGKMVKKPLFSAEQAKIYLSAKETYYSKVEGIAFIIGNIKYTSFYGKMELQ